MRMSSWLLALVLGVFTLQAQALSTHKPGELVEVSLDQLHPTQAVIGFDQIYYKLGRFAEQRSKLFDEYCETNGQGDSSRVNTASNLLDLASFDCQSPVGTHSKGMKTVVMGPGGAFYLTDGHHTFSTLWDQPGAGPQLKMWVKVTDDFSDSADSATFWTRMQHAHKTWLKDGNGQSINPSQLPEHLGLKNMQNDPFRSLVYFTRGASFGKPSSAGVTPEFLEFYWGSWLRAQLDIAPFDLGERSGYRKALQAASALMVALPGTALVGDSGFNARQLGGYSSVNSKALRKTVHDKLPYVIAYKAAHH
ncbi:ParB/Srx family N-terminal domain-containing protein [Pseudomonas sp. MH10]|uniref:ParB/Srx family N-terminal domain-containing protein n=1 Tax=Pseudomonas sp. MH10 TaxID=3048627 RepID=UPI002AC8B56F|nr:ParB/Srx family N-terminal domain-containing protein [Pseudomonas sp. MH10]MEB0043243.1 ParB/Srx family N-terminal domain-containing protein [Pseudomonas sp. MH10]WPX62266.1 ParB/Srx family N-terminal domain-containing protein [Pseudomonas sp. MH10]